MAPHRHPPVLRSVTPASVAIWRCRIARVSSLRAKRRNLGSKITLAGRDCFVASRLAMTSHASHPGRDPVIYGNAVSLQSRTWLAVSVNGAFPERARALFDFWFGPPEDPERLHHRQIWFRSTPEFDAAVRDGFAADHDQAIAGA